MFDERRYLGLFVFFENLFPFVSCQEMSFFRREHILELLLNVLYVHCRHYEQSLPYRQVNGIH